MIYSGGIILNSTVVIYESKYGTTKKYAEWISNELKATLLKKNEVNIRQLEGFDTIIYGGGLYAGGTSGISLITKNFDQMKEKNLVVFTCGIADPKNEDNIKGIQSGLNKRFSPEMKGKVTLFHLRGGIDYKKLGLVHKLMMAMLKMQLSKKDVETLTSEDKELLATYGKKIDFTDQSTIFPLVKFVQALEVNK